MTDCATAQAWIDRRLDEPLTASANAALAAHLADCPDCRRCACQWDDLGAAIDLLREQTERLPGRVIRPAPVTVPRPAWRRRIVAIAAVLALAITAGVVFRPKPSLTPSPEAPTPPPAVGVAHVRLANASASRYLPVARPTRRPDVHLFVLYQSVQPGDQR